MMATCKDCFHYCVCDLIVHKMPDVDFYANKVEVLCGNFKNKADFQEVKHGEWKKHIDDDDCDYIECSVCGEEFYPPNNEVTFDVIPKYCQNCGARMDGDKNE